jgi:energy-coupling factor transporter ATP-binding protein EcfA2
MALVEALRELRELSRRLGERVESAPTPEDASDAARLRHHIDELLIPRAVDLDAPLVVVILGSTGSGKSSLINAIAGTRFSPSGVIRPTTKVAKAMVHPADVPLELLPALRAEGEIELAGAEAAIRGLVIVDAPDLDSVEAKNRAMARRLLEIADLLVFVTTATRYADEVPWKLLDRARQRGIAMITVINRLPESDSDRTAVVDDYRRMLVERDLDEVGIFGAHALVEVGEGEVDHEVDGLQRDAITPLLATLERLKESDQIRREVAGKGLISALGGLPAAVAGIADRMVLEAAEAAELLVYVEGRYQQQQSVVLGHIDRGTFLRSEIIGQWHEFVGTNRVVRIVSEGVGRMAAGVRSLFNPGPPAPAGEVKAAAFEDLVALVVSHADSAASAAAAHWSGRPYGDAAVAINPQLWGATPDLAEQVEEGLERWAASISREVRTLGEHRRGWAKAASIGVNAIGTSAILAVFASTGGLTGAEAGIAAVTAMVNQALLEALFGEANVADMIDRARNRLDEMITESMSRERARFETALGIETDRAQRAEQMREVARHLARTEL